MKLLFTVVATLLGGVLLYWFPLPAQATWLPDPPFAPNRPAVTAPHDAQVSHSRAPDTTNAATADCPNALANGGFEQESDWSADPRANTSYDTRYAHSGSRSLSMNTLDGRNVDLWQRLTIPANATEVTLSFDAMILSGAVDQNVYVSIYDTHFTQRLQSYPLIFDCDCVWHHFTPALDVATLAGRTVNLLFQVAADGTIDEVNLDDVTLGVCQSGPTATPIPRPMLLAPQGEIHTDTPSFTWQGFPDAVRYLLWVNQYGDPNIPGKIELDYTPAEANCATGSTCTVNPGVPFTNEGGWWITAYFADGAIASESEGAFFTINAQATATTTATPPATATPTPSATATTMPSQTPATATATAPPASPTPTATASPTAGAGDAYEVDDDCTSAKPLTTDGLPQTHTFHTQGDADWLRFPVRANTSYLIEGDVPGASAVDLILSLYTRCNSGATTTQDYNFSPNVRLAFTATQSADYYLKLVNNKADRYGDDMAYQIAVRALTTTTVGGALIIVAGRNQEGDVLQTQIHNITNRVYRLWRNQGFPANRIRYLATDLSLDPDKDGKPDVNSLPDNANLRQALTEWAVSQLSGQQSLTLYLMDHGGYDKLYLDEPRRERLVPADLDQWLTTLQAAVPGVRITVIIEACNAGSFIDPEKSISKSGRVVMTSAGAYELAWATDGGALFSDALLDGLAQGKTLLGAFYEAQANTQHTPSVQTPWLDDDGDGIPNDGDDGALAAQLSFRVPGAFDHTATLWQPYIVQGAVHTATDTRREIWAEVRDDGNVESVWAVIYPPSYQPATGGEALVSGPPPITLQARGNHEYAGLYGAFDEPGDYRIEIYALDDDGLHSPVKVITFNNGSRLFLPLIQK